ncbi:adenosine deaminase family protein [Azospirillum sp. ST 5-10]|uniref:adenosine deaminase family protein n=1 Tax=unclassified Azospirillum TaxID=2630922 RepID=UPI003F4A37E2
MLRHRPGRTAAIVLLLLASGCAGLPPAGTPDGASGDAAARFAAVKDDPPALRAFLHRMPKGADLHTHLTGAVYGETYVRAAAAAGLCFDQASGALVTPEPPCDAAAGRPPAAAALSDGGLNTRIVNALSMRSFVPESGVSGHDQFFATFGRFSAAARDPAALVAEVADRAGRQRVQHLELMTTAQGGAVRALGAALAWTGDLAAMRGALLQAGLPALVEAGRRDIDAVERRRRQLQRCGTPQATPGCDVSVRYLQQVSRTAAKNQVYAQTVYAFLLAEADPRVVGLNFVGPEDHPVALADYDLHMRMLDHLHRLHPGVGIALHAGELTLGLVPPEELRSHIRQAVETGHAGRIGHGVDVMYEDDPYGLLRTMAQRRIAVEINLTSNDVILGVRGRQHPFALYRAAGVPTVITTDDEGVSRSDLTNELQRAVEAHGLGYADLVRNARAGLEHSFLPGASLWDDAARGVRVAPCRAAAPAGGALPDACRSLLDASEKARLQWRLEEALAAFEREAAGGV